MHKWSITPPEFIYIDLKCQGTASSSAQGTGYLIVYGIKGSQNDVDSSVYDSVYAVENGKMVMQTDVDMNGYKINSSFFFTGYFNKSKSPTRIFLNGENPLQVIPFDCRLTKISCIFPETRDRNYQFTLNLSLYWGGIRKYSFNSTRNNKNQNFDIDVRFSADDFFVIEMFKKGTRQEIDPDWGVFSFVFFQ